MAHPEKTASLVAREHQKCFVQAKVLFTLLCFAFRYIAKERENQLNVPGVSRVRKTTEEHQRKAEPADVEI